MKNKHRAPKPVYLLAGRGSSNSAIFKAVFGEISNSNPVIAYVGAANNDDKRFYKFMSDEVTKDGRCTMVQALLASPRADIKKAREILESADAVFMSGGDVEAGIQVLDSHGLGLFFRELYEMGKVFIGASAGSIMLAREWVRWRDSDDDATAEMFPCLNIAPVLIDTHAEEDDWEELKAALKLVGPGGSGYGIPSGSCLKVYPGGRIDALGGPVAHFANQSEQAIRLHDIV